MGKAPASPEGPKQDQPESGVSDQSWGDGRAPTEMNWGLESLPERVPEAALSVVVRKGPRTDPQQPRVAMAFVQRLGGSWSCAERRSRSTTDHLFRGR